MAAGAGISRLGDFESGHDCWHPVKTITACKNVMINKVLACTIGDITSIHTCGKKPPHFDKIVKGSKKVLINKRPAARIGDSLTGGAVMAQGSHSVLAG
jgi:uncharacterized Zn-binding protein involved in type VI secretion